MITRTSCAALCVMAATGCHGPRLAPTPATAPLAASCAGAYDSVFEKAKDVLRRHRFRLDRTDYDTGHITTHPVGSQHFFEFWRDDVATPHDAWEATLTNMRRRAVVDISRSTDAQHCTVTVTVLKQRFSTPERQITNSAAAAHFLSSNLPAAASGRDIPQADSFWLDQGRDPAMEAKLRHEIVAAVAIARPSADDPPRARP